MEYLSNSQINLYSQCSLKYKFSYVDLLPKPFKSSGLAFGSVMHSALSWFHRESMTNGGVALEKLFKIFDADWFSQRAETEIRYKDAEEEMRLAVMAKEMLTMYYKLPPKKAKASELSFSIPLTAPGNGQDPLIDIEGVIDLIEADDVITEFKTSAQMMDARDAEESLQLTIYSYAYEKLYQKPPKALKIIDFVKMLQPSFGAVNLEDISQPNCFRVLDELREACDIPVWHDDAQGTACVTLAGLLNALKLAGKRIGDARIVLLGAGASNTTIARLILADGGDPAKLCLFDTKGSLHALRADIESDPRAYRKWELCQKTNPERYASEGEALKGADVLIALSSPGPDTVKREWVRGMAPRAIVFCCANPVPEIWPYAAKEEGAFIVATGRGDFPNQVNNSVCFPGLLKGALLARARKITDGMAIRCAHSIAGFAEKRGISPEDITARMDETEVFAIEAADVADQAAKEGVARAAFAWRDIHDKALADILESRRLTDDLMRLGHIAEPPQAMLDEALSWAIEQVRK